MEGLSLVLGIVWILYSVLLLPIYLLKQGKHGLIKAMPYKLILSLVFCFMGFGSLFQNGVTMFSALIVLGLIASFVGDYYLIYIQTDDHKFIKGIFYFGIAHFFYITAMANLIPIRMMEIVITFVFLIILFLIKTITKPQMGKAEIPMSLYSIFVTFMAVKAISMMFASVPPLTHQWLFSLGAMLFLISDLCLGVWRYVYPKKILSQVVAVTYFVGQLMLATVLYFQ